MEVTSNEAMFRKYAELKINVKRAAEEMSEQSKRIKNIMESSHQDEVQLTGLGKFYLQERREYTYPENILELERQLESLEEKLKEARKEVEIKGDAPYIVNKILVFKEEKKND